MSLPKPDIVVVADSEDQAVREVAHRLAEQLHLPLISDAAARTHSLVLVVTRERLELRDGESRRGVFADFSFVIDRGRKIARNQLLGRAIGKRTKRVVDATAGLGRDAAMLACMGYQVTAVERSPVLFALLMDGLRRAMMNESIRSALGDRLEIVDADARQFLATVRPHPDAVYIDPMFPPKRRASSLAKKQIRILRQLVGDDTDAGELVAIARRHARRIIVKRPDHATPLAPEPSISFRGKLVRYDVYVRAKVTADAT